MVVRVGVLTNAYSVVGGVDHQQVLGLAADQSTAGRSFGQSSDLRTGATRRGTESVDTALCQAP